MVGSSQEGAGEEEGQHCAASQTNSACSETFAPASGPSHNHAITTCVPVQNVAPPCRGGLPAPPHGGGQGPTSSRVPERSARPSLPPFPPLFCASASVCGCPLSPVRQYIISIIFKLGEPGGRGGEFGRSGLSGIRLSHRGGHLSLLRGSGGAGRLPR